MKKKINKKEVDEVINEILLDKNEVLFEASNITIEKITIDRDKDKDYHGVWIKLSNGMSFTIGTSLSTDSVCIAGLGDVKTANAAVIVDYMAKAFKSKQEGR